MQSKIRYVDSEYRTSGTATNFKYKFPRVEDVSQFTISDVSFFNNQYNVDDRNDTVYFTVSATLYTATVNHGRYSGTTYASAIESAMNDELAGNTVSYSTSTNKLTISRADNLILNTTMTSNAIWNFAGYYTSSDHTGSLSYESDNQINTTTKYYYMTLDFCDNPDLSFDLPDETALIIINSQSWGTLINIKASEEFINCKKRSFEFFNATVYDDRNNVVDSQGIPFSFKLTFR